jgi:hypothetical protein
VRYSYSRAESVTLQLVTIELYDFRLANIGDPHYDAAANPVHSMRHSAVPLGVTSNSTSKEKWKNLHKSVQVRIRCTGRFISTVLIRISCNDIESYIEIVLSRPLQPCLWARYSNKERKKFCFEGLSSILSTCKRSKRRENDTHAAFGSDEHDMVPSWLSMRVGSRNRGTSSGT